MEGIDNIIRILQQDPDSRSDQDVDKICAFLADSKFLKQFQANGRLPELARLMRVEFFTERAKVFDEGETGDKFYIVLTGRVTVYKGVKSEIGTMMLRRLVDLNEGDSFGELAL
jgi:CRP-like cAMP-binding protein